MKKLTIFYIKKFMYSSYNLMFCYFILLFIFLLISFTASKYNGLIYIFDVFLELLQFRSKSKHLVNATSHVIVIPTISTKIGNRTTENLNSHLAIILSPPPPLYLRELILIRIQVCPGQPL